MEVAPADSAAAVHRQQRDRGTAVPPAAAWADSTTVVGVWEAAAHGRDRQQPAERPLVLHRHPDTELEFATRGFLWYVLLLLLFVTNRLWCFIGLPSDGQHNWNGRGVANNLVGTLFYGVSLGAAAGVLDRWRAAHLARRPWVPIVMVATGPAYSGISDLDAGWGNLSSSESNEQFGAVSIIVLAFVATLVIGLLIWHVYFCSSLHPGRTASVAYVGLRLAVLVVWAMGTVCAGADGGVVHVHHWWVAWWLGSWCKFNHPLSDLCLAICVGIFMQGVGAYNLEVLWREDSCYSFKANGQISTTDASPNDPKSNFWPVSTFSCFLDDTNPARVCLNGDHSVDDLRCTWT